MPSSPLTTKLPAILLTLLPLLLLLPAFILSAYSTSSGDWTWRLEYDETLALLGTAHRGPFQTCILTSVLDAKNLSIPKCFHTRRPGGLCDSDSTARADNMAFCRQLALGGRLLYAGNALLATALLLVSILTAATLPSLLRSRTGTYGPTFLGTSLGSAYAPVPASTSSNSRHHHNNHHNHHDGTAPSIAASSPFLVPASLSLPSFLSSFLALLSSLSFLLLLTGLFITTNVLVNFQYPMGDWYTTGNPNNIDIVRQDLAGPWLIGKAPGQAAAGAVMAVVAAGVVGRVWGGVRVGVSAVVDGGDGEVGEGVGGEEERGKVEGGEERNV